MNREKLNELMAEFYGTEEDDFEGGVIEDNSALADWARHVVPELFDATSKLLAVVNGPVTIVAVKDGGTEVKFTGVTLEIEGGNRK